MKNVTTLVEKALKNISMNVWRVVYNVYNLFRLNRAKKIFVIRLIFHLIRNIHPLPQIKYYEEVYPRYYLLSKRKWIISRIWSQWFLLLYLVQLINALTFVWILKIFSKFCKKKNLSKVNSQAGQLFYRTVSLST